MSRVYNFSAGPAVLPEEVLKRSSRGMLDYRGCGMSVMEISHRSKMFENIIQEDEADLRDLLEIPDNYKVLFFRAAPASSCHDPYESYEEPGGRLYRYRPVGQEGMAGSPEVWKGK